MGLKTGSQTRKSSRTRTCCGIWSSSWSQEGPLFRAHTVTGSQDYCWSIVATRRAIGRLTSRGRKHRLRHRTVTKTKLMPSWSRLRHAVPKSLTSVNVNSTLHQHWLLVTGISVWRKQEPVLFYHCNWCILGGVYPTHTSSFLLNFPPLPGRPLGGHAWVSQPYYTDHHV